MSQTLVAANGRAAVPASYGGRSGSLDDPAVNEVVWAYAVTEDLDPGQLSGLTGVDCEPVRVVTEAGLTVVAGSVDAAVFGEESLTSLLASPLNIELIGRAHHRVVDCTASYGPVVPLRLATIYPDDLTIRTLLAERRAELAELLRSFRGTQEWGVKVHMEPLTGSADGDSGAASFTAPDDLFAREPRWRQAEAHAETIDRALSGIAIATQRHPAPYPQLIDGEGWMVLNGVYLLDTERVAEFDAMVHNLTGQQAGLWADVSGPWPPYSFVDPQEDCRFRPPR